MTVNAYSYPSGALLGTSRGFDNPDGECVKEKGTFGIANVGTAQLLEYKAGGATPITTINDPAQGPSRPCEFRSNH